MSENLKAGVISMKLLRGKFKRTSDLQGHYTGFGLGRSNRPSQSKVRAKGN
jgi:hypothetical protein